MNVYELPVSGKEIQEWTESIQEIAAWKTEHQINPKGQSWHFIFKENKRQKF